MSLLDNTNNTVNVNIIDNTDLSEFLSDKYIPFYVISNTSKGPINELVPIYNIKDFKSVFGLPLKDNYKEWYNIYNYFLYNNKSIFIIRVQDPKSKYANIIIPSPRDPRDPEFLDCLDLPLNTNLKDLENRFHGYLIKAKDVGINGNDISIQKTSNNLVIYQRNDIVEEWNLKDPELVMNSNYIEIFNELDPDMHFERIYLRNGQSIEASEDLIQQAYYDYFESNYFSQNIFVLLNTKINNYSKIIDYLEKYDLIGIINKNIETKSRNILVYEGHKRQSDIFTNKEIESEISADVLGIRNYFLNNSKELISHCKRFINVLDINLNSKVIEKSLMDFKIRQNINFIIKDNSIFRFYSEKLKDSTDLTNRVIEIIIKRELENLGNYFIFEFNDSFTKFDLKTKVQMLLEKFQAKRYIQEFNIKCDESNQDPEDPNKIICDIYYKPQYLVKRIDLRIIARNQ